jgi:hypothetical protein
MRNTREIIEGVKSMHLLTTVIDFIIQLVKRRSFPIPLQKATVQMAFWPENLLAVHSIEMNE